MATSGFDRDAKQEELTNIRLQHLIDYSEEITKKIQSEVSLKVDISFTSKEFTYIREASEHFKKLVEAKEFNPESKKVEAVTVPETGLTKAQLTRNEDPLDNFDDATTILESEDLKINNEYKIVQHLVRIRNWILVQQKKLLDAEKFLQDEYQNIVLPDYTSVRYHPEFDKVKSGNDENAKKLKTLDENYDKLKGNYLLLIENFHSTIKNFKQVKLHCPPFKSEYEEVSDQDNLVQLLEWTKSVLNALHDPQKLSQPNTVETEVTSFKIEADKLIKEMDKIKSEMEGLLNPKTSHAAVKTKIASKAYKTLGAEQKISGELVNINENKSAPKKGDYIVCYVFEGKTDKQKLLDSRPFGHVALWDGQNYYSYGDPHYNVKKLFFGSSPKADKNIKWKKFNVAEDESDVLANQETSAYGNYKKFIIPVDAIFLKKRPLFQNEFLTAEEAKAIAEVSPNANLKSAGKWSTDNYRIKSQNCVHMVRVYLELAGFEIRNRAMLAETPSDFGKELTSFLKMHAACDNFIQKAKQRENENLEKFISALAADPLKQIKEQRYREEKHNFKRAYLALLLQATAQKDTPTTLRNLQSDLQLMLSCKVEDLEINYWNIASKIGIKLFTSKGDKKLKTLFEFLVSPLNQSNYDKLTQFVFPSIEMKTTPTRARSKTSTESKTSSEPAPIFLNRRGTVAPSTQQSAIPDSKKGQAPK